MTRNSAVILICVMLFFTTLKAVTIHEIQFSTTGGTYDSPYAGQTVTIENAIVTAKGFSGDKFYISDPAGGPWSGLYVYNTNSSYASALAVGDLISISGTVTEYYGLTELGSIASPTVISHSNPVPAAIFLETGTATTPAQMEQYESCLVEYRDIQVTQTPSATYYEWYVDDGSGRAQIDDGFTQVQYFPGLTITVGQTWARIRGIVDYNHNEYGVNPRNSADMLQAVTLAGSVIQVGSVTEPNNQLVSLPMTTSEIKAAWHVNSFSFKVKINTGVLSFDGIDFDNSMLENEENYPMDLLHIVPDTLLADTWDITYTGTHDIVSTTESDTLLYLRFHTINYGESSIVISGFSYNTTSIAGITNGSIKIPVDSRKAVLNIYSYDHNGNRNIKNIFNPKYNERMIIEYGGKADTSPSFKAIIRIYDVQGRLVNTLKNEVVSSSTGIATTQWDGRDRTLCLVPIGLYYCHLEIIDRTTGKSETTVQPIVVGTPLK